MRKRLLLTVLLFAMATCNESGDGSFAPTGAKAITDEFGNQIYVDEECGGVDQPSYADSFQNALFRDGAVFGGYLYTVDGSHLWRAAIPEYAEAPTWFTVGVPTPRIARSFLGHANAVTAGSDFLAVSLVDRGVVVYPYGKLESRFYFPDRQRAIDVAAKGSLLAVGAGSEGLFIYDMANPANPLLLYARQVTGHVVGVEWSIDEERTRLYYAACSRIGYLDFTDGFADPVWHSSPSLEHRNAKDIAATGQKALAANNGKGLWFFDEELTFLFARDSSDPNFYANAVAIDGEVAYLAAGNRELSAFRLDGRPFARIPRDPIGINTNDGLVYGFGNFREAGERTIERAPTVAVRGIAGFEEGFAQLVESYYAQVAAVPGDAGTDAYRVSLFVDGKHRVYERAATETSWRPLPGYLYYGGGEGYSVEVTSDSLIRVYENAVTLPVAEFPLQESFQGEFARTWSIRSYAKSFLVSYEWRGLRTDLHYTRSDYYEEWLETPIETQHYIGQKAIKINYVGEPVEYAATILDRYPEPSDSLIFMGRWVGNHYFYGLSGQLDGPFYFKGENSSGVVEDYGGVIDFVPHTGGIILLLDDRRSLTTALVFLDARGEETERWVHFGRPSSLMLEEGGVRVWFADGSSFWFDPAGPRVRLAEIEAIVQEAK